MLLKMLLHNCGSLLETQWRSCPESTAGAGADSDDPVSRWTTSLNVLVSTCTNVVNGFESVTTCFCGISMFQCIASHPILNLPVKFLTSPASNTKFYRTG